MWVNDQNESPKIGEHLGSWFSLIFYRPIDFFSKIVSEFKFNSAKFNSSLTFDYDDRIDQDEHHLNADHRKCKLLTVDHADWDIVTGIESALSLGKYLVYFCV